MDTPALTPETLGVSSLESPPAHQQTKQLRVSSSSNNITMAFDHLSFFAKSACPLSPPESPFGFNNAFSKPPQPATPMAPASPHFELPARVTRNVRSSKVPAQSTTQFWSRNFETRAEDNPYFPSITEQERTERWMRDSARLSQASLLPSAPVENTPPTEEDTPSASTSREEEEDLAAAILDIDLSLSPLERRRALKISLPARKTEDFPASPESLSSSMSMPPASAEEYRRTMARHLEEVLRRKQTRVMKNEQENETFSW